MKHIFTTNQPNSISIFLQGWDKCVFKAEFPKRLQNQHSTCVVRLESEDEEPKKFIMIAAMQKIAATIIPDHVPKTLPVGKAANAQGRMFHFSVVEIVEGDLLEDVWQLMGADEQRNVLIELVEAVQKLHSVQLSDNMALEVLRKMPREDGEELRPFFFFWKRLAYLVDLIQEF